MRTIRTIRLLLLALVLVAIQAMTIAPTASAAFGFGISITIGPPALPVYAQPICPATAIFGRPAIGPTATPDTSGPPAPGFSRRASASSGRPATGAGAAADIFGTPDIGARTLASMAELITASAMAASVSKAAIGTAATFSTIAA